MLLKSNQIVELRNGIYGVTADFNGKPFQLIFRSYTSPIGKYDDNLKNKNSTYDIVKIYDGSKLENVLDVFKNKFNPSELDLIWEEKQ